MIFLIILLKKKCFEFSNCNKIIGNYYDNGKINLARKLKTLQTTMHTYALTAYVIVCVAKNIENISNQTRQPTYCATPKMTMKMSF